MSDNKFNYVAGIALVVLMVLVVYLGGRVKTVESDVNDLHGRVSDVESFLDLTTAPVDDQSSLLLDDSVMPEDLEGYSLGAFDDYYGADDSYYYDYPADDYSDAYGY